MFIIMDQMMANASETVVITRGLIKGLVDQPSNYC